MANNTLKLEILLNLIANKAKSGVSTATVKKVLRGTYEVILEELELNEEIGIYNFGKFYTADFGGYDKVAGNLQTGESELIYLDKQKVVRFKPSSMFKKSINENNFKLIIPKKKKKYKNRDDYNSVRRDVAHAKKISTEQMFFNILNEKNKEARKAEKDETNI